MIRRITVLAAHSLRVALRSRMVIALLALLAIVAIVFPRSLQGDGTAESEIRLLLTWTLGLAAGLLAVTSLWTACGTISLEAADGLLTGVVVTSARPFEIWLGKWLGIVILNGVLLAFVLAATALQLRLRGVATQDLRPDLRLTPAEASLWEHAEIIAANAIAQGDMPPDSDPEALARQVMKGLKTEHFAINPGETHHWWFNWAPWRARHADVIRVTVEMFSSFGSMIGIQGECRVLDDEGTILAQAPLDSEDGRRVTMEVPTTNLRESKRINVELINKGGSEQAAVLVGAADGAIILVPSGNFIGNLLAAGFVLWMVMATLAAIGITAGAMFSMPVAIFLATAIVMIGIVSHGEISEETDHGHDHGGSGDTSSMLSGSWAVHTLKAVARLTDPIAEADPLGRLGERRKITAEAALTVWASAGLLVPALMCILGMLALRRREYPQ